MRRFAKDTYCTGGSKSDITVYGVSLAASSYSSPVSLSGSDGLTLYAYKDDTVDSITIKPSTSVLFYTNFIQRDENGALINVASFDIGQDGTVYIYDVYGNPITEWPSQLYYLAIEYVKTPTVLSGLSDASSLAEDYDEAVCDWVIASLYPTRTDMPTLDRLQLEKHYKNRYDIQMQKARKYYRQHNTLMSYSGSVDGIFD